MTGDCAGGGGGEGGIHTSTFSVTVAVVPIDDVSRVRGCERRGKKR